MRIATWNVGGLQARREELVRWLQENQPAVMGLQEIKTGNAKFLHRLRDELLKEGYHAEFHEQARWNGVAILSKHPLKVTQKGLPGQEDRGKRLLTACTAGLSFTTVCVPVASGEGPHQRRIKRKLAWLDSLSDHLRERKTDYGPAVLCGDFNINPKPIDNYHHWEKTTEPKNDAGFQEDERSRISSLLEAGWFDLVREANSGCRTFSWWQSPEFYCKNKGLRIDLAFGNRAVFERLQTAQTDRSPLDQRDRGKRSDHAPVIVDLA